MPFDFGGVVLASLAQLEGGFAPEPISRYRFTGGLPGLIRFRLRGLVGLSICGLGAKDQLRIRTYA